MRTDAEVNFHLLYAETLRQVNRFAERVAENRDVMQALDFARYVLNSHLVKVLEPAACDGLLKVDPGFLKWKCEDLMRACQARFACNDSKPHLEGLQLQSLHEKLNTIAGYLSKLVVVGPGTVKPDLTVISGGLEVEDQVSGSVQKQANGCG